MRYLIGMLFFAVSTAAFAAPVEWTLQDVQFEDGGTAYGSFTFDADLGQFSDVNVTTTSGTMFSGLEYDGCHGFFGCTESAIVVGIDSDLNQWFGFALDSPLTNAGGTRQLVIAPCQASCEIVDIDTGSVRNVVSGSVSAVPIPTAVWLFGSALAGLGFVRRRVNTP